MEEWGFIDERVAGMEGRLRLHHLPALHLRGGSALPHPVGLQPQAAAVQQGEHLKKKCKLWAPTWQKEVGWTSEADSHQKRNQS